MSFEDVLVNREKRYAIGIERESGRYYVSIPVSNRLVDYDEYYEIDAEMFRRFQSDPAGALDFVTQCRRREMKHRLMFQPGADRGVPS